MRKKSIPILAVMVFLILSSVYCISAENNNTKDESYISTADEIIFHSNGSSFSPVIVLQAAAEVLWTWDDNTTSNSTKPVKDYGSAKLRVNKLKVTPWSAVRRINIGYTAEDDGSLLIERVADQKVSLVENLYLVAPNLIEWCSSYNMLTDLDFSNFINIETIELFRSNLNNLSIVNTPNLKRLCFEIGKINTLDLTTSSQMEDLRGANNRLPSIVFPANLSNIWHICVHHNPFISKTFFNDNMPKFPEIAELLIDYSYQEGPLIIEKSSKTRNARIRGYNNKYTSIDFHNCLKEPFLKARIQMQNNEITTVNIEGCIQINELDLNNNRLQTNEIDNILRQVNDYNTYYGSIDLRNNQPPSSIGINYINTLKARGWEIQTDPPIPVQSIEILSAGGNTITTTYGNLQLTASVLPDNATTKSVTWSVLNLTGEATISSTGLLTAVKNGTVKAIATANDGSAIKGEFLITIASVSIQLSIKVMLEGVNTGSLMSTLLKDHIPLMHPYNVAPWYYSGTEAVSSIPANVVDWIFVELRQATTPNEATSSTIFAKCAAFLKSDGSIVDHLTGDILTFNDKFIDSGNSLFVVIRHRNHLAIMSSSCLTMENGIYRYDFTTGINQAYGGDTGYKITGMVAGDIDQDGNIFVSDYNIWASGFGQTKGYYGCDLNMDGDAFVSDYNIWANNFGSTLDKILKSTRFKSKYFSNVPN